MSRRRCESTVTFLHKELFPQHHLTTNVVKLVNMTTEEEVQKLKRDIWSNQSIIRMMEGNTDLVWLKKLEREWNDPIRDRIAELEKGVDCLSVQAGNVVVGG